MPYNIYQLLFVSALIWSAPLQAETLTAVVKDINTHSEISAVNIFIRNGHAGTTSDASGNFTLQLQDTTSTTIIVFQHIAYDPVEFSWSELSSLSNIFLQPRVIPLQGVEVEGVAERMDIERDLPQTVSVLRSRDFEIRGYTDAADLLRIDNSIQVDEQVSGRKTVSIRGGNPDEVAVLYNGVKMNRTFDNVFDMSTVDVQDVERFEIIKGSNTTLYGPEAFSGVINIVPKLQTNYNIRFQQRFGTYRSGSWGLQLNKALGNFHGGYSLKKGATVRRYADVAEENANLDSRSTHQNANLSWQLGRKAAGTSGTLSGMWVYSNLDFDNNLVNEAIRSKNNVASIRYDGKIAGIDNLLTGLSRQWLNESQQLASSFGFLDRAIDEKSTQFDLQKGLDYHIVDFLFAYQYKGSDLDWQDARDFENQLPVGLESSVMQRRHHGLAAIAKYHGETGSDFLQTFDIDVSIRHDRVKDKQKDAISRNNSNESPGFFEKNDWNDTMLKLAVNMQGYKNGLALDSNFIFGSNTKFPTLFQQISAPNIFADIANQPDLNPEHNNSVEFGATVLKDLGHKTVYSGWQIMGTFFQNQYDNKFRSYTTPGIPVSFYENVPKARIAGLESTASIFLYRKKVNLEGGASRYFISDKAAFPFKSDRKITGRMTIDHQGYSFQAFIFHEGKQSALIRSFNSLLLPVTLPAYTNMDLHFSKAFELIGVKLFANMSARNILKDDQTQLEGITIRDRRFYITIGAQY